MGNNFDILASGGTKCQVCGKWTEPEFMGLYSPCKYCDKARSSTIQKGHGY